MTRMLGVISGAAIAIALLTWLVGVPQFTSERPTDLSPVRVVELSNPVSASAPATGAPAEAAPGPAGEPPSAVAAATPANSAPEAAPPDTADIPAPVAPAPEADAAVPADLQSVESEDAQWFAFWSPFRSEVAANGFVGRLQRVTGLDYRVVKVEPGVYEVAFAYSDETEIDSYLSTISAATGLDLPGAP